MTSVEILKARKSNSDAIVDAIAKAAKRSGDKVVVTSTYQGKSDWLVLFGVGAEVNDAARNEQVGRGRRALLWDLAYVKRTDHFRMSIDTDHPPQWLERTIVTGERWDSFGIPLREEFNPAGHIVLVGLGRKSRKYLNLPTWEEKQLPVLRQRFPDRRIVFRPKKNDPTRLDCEMDTESPIEDVIRGASLVVCRHSNVAVDATIAGVPFEAENGAAMWLQEREFTPANRLEFLRRLAWWQWKPSEAAQALAFAKHVVTR